MCHFCLANKPAFIVDTLFEIFIFVQKFNFDFPRKSREIAARGFGLFSCWQLEFHEKNF